MNVLLGYANSLSRDFAQSHLGNGQLDFHIITAGPLADCLQLTRDLLLAGAAGYLPYSMSADALVGAIKLIAAGEIFVPVDMMNASSEEARDRLLTKREREVLTGLLAGQSNREIAHHLSLSEVTIKHHLKSLRSKLGAKNRTHAVCRAIELGLR